MKNFFFFFFLITFRETKQPSFMSELELASQLDKIVIQLASQLEAPFQQGLRNRDVVWQGNLGSPCAPCSVLMCIDCDAQETLMPWKSKVTLTAAELAFLFISSSDHSYLSLLLVYSEEMQIHNRRLHTFLGKQANIWGCRRAQMNWSSAACP